MSRNGLTGNGLEEKEGTSHTLALLSYAASYGLPEDVKETKLIVWTDEKE
jgi:hypothetical protein